MYVSVTTLEEERAELMALKETLQKYVRQLEQSNDDLERGKRWVSCLSCKKMSWLLLGSSCHHWKTLRQN